MTGPPPSVYALHSYETTSPTGHRCSWWPGVVLQLYSATTPEIYIPVVHNGSPAGGRPNDASDMLAAALEQMDDIIAGTKLQSAELQNGLMESEQTHFTSPGYGDPTMIPKLAEDLRIAAERADEQGEGLIYRDQVPQWTKDFLSQWLQSNGALMDDDVYQNPHDRVQRLESEKHSLHLQVNVLSEQVEIQTEKIQELEYALSDSDRKLFDTESRLQEERRMRRPSYDDVKRNESNELVQLQLRLSSAENEVALLRERTLQAE
ncbi:putative liprin-beta-1-like, partial [Apostichopus japonicus]